MKIVRLNKTPAEFSCQQFAHCRFASARNSENDYDHNVLLCAKTDVFHGERDKNKQRVEDPNTCHCGCIRQCPARHIRIPDLNNDESSSKRNHSSLANYRHRISCKIKSDPASKQRDFQRKLRVPIVPQTEADFPSVVVDREIARVRNEIENPMREDCEPNDQGRRLTVAAAVPAADRPVTNAATADQITAVIKLCKYG